MPVGVGAGTEVVPAPASGGGRGRSGGPQKRKGKQIMATVALNRFSDQDTLRRIGDGFVIGLLSPYRAFLIGRDRNRESKEAQQRGI
jgi:hypothetical protein